MGDLDKILSEFNKRKVLVLGDVMLDKWIFGEVSRISPEVSVPVVDFTKEETKAGGAANVAINLANLGAEVYLFGVIGKDNPGKELSQILESKAIKFFPEYLSFTTEKTRIIGGRQHITRLDKEDKSPKDPKFSQLEEYLDKAEVIVVSDYAKGTLNHELMNRLKKSGKKIIVDPKPVNINLYENTFLIKMNEKEFKDITRISDVKKAGDSLRERLKANIVLTQGQKGMTLFPLGNSEISIPADAREVYDVVGAGDTTTAVLALAIASNSSLEDSAILANYAAGIKVGKFGTASVSLSELEKKIFHEEGKVKTREELYSIVEKLRHRKERIVWTNGCFNLLHEGHVDYLKKASKLGDILIVGLNSDQSVKQLKGEAKLIRPQLARAEIISALECVDYVTIFDDSNVTSLLYYFKPDVFVKGGDYTIDTLNQDERKAVDSYGGKIEIIPIEKSISTTEILSKIRTA